MDPFARKMIRSSFAYGGVLLFLFATLTVVYLHVRPPCNDEVIAEVQSPDHKWIADVMQRRCGDESPFVTHVNLRPAAGAVQFAFFTGKATQGEVFAVEQDASAAKIELKWTSPDRLAIECSGCIAAFMRKRQERWRDLTIAYFLDNG